MKIKLYSLFILLALLAGVHQAAAQSPVISSFGQNGVLVCTNLQPGSVASVEWSSVVSGPWHTNWAGLSAVTVNSNGMIQVSVPMFYRVRGMACNTNTTTPDGMALIPAGMFIMGDSLDGDSDATPTVIVTVSGFYMDTNLVSASQWETVYNWATANGYSFDNPGSAKAANHPVQTVNWYDVVKWSNARSAQAGLTPVYYTDAGFTQVFTNGDSLTSVYANWTANGYRLPTEAEWEKAARGGLSGQRFPWGNTISESQANYHGCISGCGFTYDLGPNGFNTNFNNGGYPYTSPVGYFAPNGYGLYDMPGNVCEWCWDGYAGPTYPAGSPYLGGTDPRGPVGLFNFRVLRGGYWGGYADYSRCAFRSYCIQGGVGEYLGFRCVRGL